MNKKILSTLLIASIAISGLFANPYSVPEPNKTAILNASATQANYAFTIQYGTEIASNTSATATEAILLDTFDVQTTLESFSIRTASVANESTAISITAVVTTGAFTNATTGASSSFPFIRNTSTDRIIKARPVTESHSYSAEVVAAPGKYLAPSVGTYTRTLAPGSHEAGTVIASFKLRLRGNDTIGAGIYVSTTTVNVTADEA
jgi:hypothetical protein